MIVIRQDKLGQIAIDLTKEPEFDIETDGIELTSGLYVIELGPREIIVDDTGRLAPVLDYIQNDLETREYEVTLDSTLDRLLRLSREETHLVSAIRNGKIKTATLHSPSKYGIQRSLLSHQQKAVKHALTVNHAADFSVPGSGKTTIALSVYAALRYENIVDRLLVIGPASSFAPWQEEFRATLGRDPKIVRLIGTKAHRERLLQHLDGVDIVLCTYQMAHREKENLERALKQARYFFILDESHHIKNIRLGPWAQTAIDLAPMAERRMILSGTPAPHSLLDIWSQFTFLWPSQSMLGTRVQYEQRVQSSEQTIVRLRKDIAPFFNRTKKSDLNLPEPEPHFTLLPSTDIPPLQRLIIRLLEIKTLQEAKNIGMGKADVGILRRWRRARTIRLLQAISNPALLGKALPELGEVDNEPLDRDASLAALLKDYSRREIPAKVAVVIKIVRQLVSQGKKVVVWVTFTDNIHLLKKHLADLKPLVVYGEVPAYEEELSSNFESREKNIRDFKDLKSGRNVLLATPAACSESISLQTICSDAIYLERTFNCGQFLQSMDRIHRVGMPRKKRPQYYIPLLPSAIERVVDRRLKARQSILYTLLEDDMPILGYEEESFLIEQEDDLDLLFDEVLNEINQNINGKLD
jgi:SNF2 family DNA or RNA helicase